MEQQVVNFALPLWIHHYCALEISPSTTTRNIFLGLVIRTRVSQGVPWNQSSLIDNHR